jgi:hypothetical protein
MTKTTNRCSVCRKQLGSSYCTGCGAYYCMKDFKSHRGVLFNEMDAIIADRNDLQDKIIKAAQYSDSRGPLFHQIDEWQNITMGKVKHVADQARQQVAKLLINKRMKLNSDFKRFSQDLIYFRETENFVENDLTRLKEQIHQLNYEMKQLIKPLTIELHMEQSDRTAWNRLIYAEEKSTYGGIQERQHQVKGQFIS